jgi:hypothetical protein
MKIVFNFNVRRPLIAGVVALIAAMGWEHSASAEGVYYTTADLLLDFFPTSKNVGYQKVVLSPADRARLTRRLGYHPARDAYTFFIARSGSRIDGYALFDEENGEHLPISFAVKLSPDGVVERQEIVAYREPRGDEVRDSRFRRQFVGKSARDPIITDDDIIAISGATISSRAMAVGVRRALVLFEELIRSGQVASAAAKGESESHGARRPSL